MIVGVIIAICLICMAVAVLIYMLLTGNCVTGAWTPFENDGTTAFYIMYIIQLLFIVFVLRMVIAFFLGLISTMIWG